jgi:mono/diheme cytochrome c family protein
MTIRTNSGTVLTVILLSALAAGIAAAAPRGQTLAERWCSQCHAVTPNQSSANPDAPRFSDVAAEPSVTGYSLHAFLKTSHATMPNIMMNSDDIDDIASYILSLKPRQ